MTTFRALSVYILLISIPPGNALAQGCESLAKVSHNELPVVFVRQL